LIEFTNVTDRQTDRHHNSIGRACVASSDKNAGYDATRSRSIHARAKIVILSLLLTL